MVDRVIVFLDYQNVYQGARAAFHQHYEHHVEGQVDPLALALHLTEDSPYARELKEVRVYRGRPDNTRDPKGYAACTRQTDLWRSDPRVHVELRTLAYPRGWPSASLPGEKPREKGIDVALAIDFVTMAVLGEYDVGIMMSTDTDLKPALEATCRLARATGRPRVEVASWSGEGRHNRRLSVKGEKDLVSLDQARRLHEGGGQGRLRRPSLALA